MEQRQQKPVVAGRYRLLEEIGRGNMGKVFRVEHLHTGETFALKVLASHAGADAAVIERFKREARTPALIKSENVVKVIDADVSPELGGAPFLVMELLDGVDLEQYLTHLGKLPPLEVVKVLAQVAKALDRAHAIGIVHRDLKPANVFMHRREDGVIVKLLDFGISKLGPTNSDARITASGAIMGTPLYMPPEQALGQTAIGPAADIWAMGMLAFRLLTGKTYWTANTMAELMAAIVRDPIASPSARDEGLPSAFDAWFLRSCERSQEARWPSAGKQVEALAAALDVPASSMALPPTAQALPVLQKTMRSADLEAKPAETLADSLPVALKERAPSNQNLADSAPLSLSEGERRQVTVLSCEMALSSLEGGEVDPEDLRDVTKEYMTACNEILGKLGSPVTQTMGDGVLVYFGYPVAQGDDARRAVRAGLRIAEAANRIHERISRQLSVALSMRGGVHTGLMVTGETGSLPDAKNVVGQVPQVASSVKRTAPSNAVVISAATHRLVKSYFSCEPLAPNLEGTASQIYRVVEEAEAELGDSSDGRMPALIGREAESAMLLERFADLQAGNGHVVLLTGEAGIGKSSLLRFFRRSIEQEKTTWLEARCSPYFDSTALHPIIELLKKLAGFGDDDSPETKLAKLRAFLVTNDAGREGFALLSSLLSLPLPAVAELNLSPHRQKQKTLEAITTLLLGMTARQPVVLVIDDLHWVDPSTLELVSSLIDEGPSAGIMLVLTARNEFSSPWGGRGHISQITLSRLTKKRIEALALHITGGKALPDEVMRELVAKTDGVPLFVEELTKNVLEQSFIEDKGTHYALRKPLPPLGIPGTLRDSLTSRLDRLGSAKTTAQLCATLGRDFEYPLLRSISTQTDEDLERDLKTLVEGELLYQRGTPPRAKYSFKHSLVQETAYESLLKNARRQAHSRIANVLAESQPELCQTQPEVLAHHRAAAGQHEQAASCLLQAGQLALQRSANVEAIAHFSRGIELCDAMPPSGDRNRLESTLHTILGVPLMMTKGYGAVEVEKTYAKALSLTSGAEAGQMLPVLWGLWIFYHVRANYRNAYEVSEKLLALAEGSSDQTVQVCAHLAHGSTSLLTGKLETARTHLQRSIDSYDPVQHRSHAYLFGQDSLAFARAMLGWDLWLLGFPDQAVRVADESIRWAREVMHPHSLAFAQGLTGALHQYRGDRATAASVSGELIAMAGEQGLLHWLSAGRIVHGWATSGPTTDNEGIPEMEEGRAVWRGIGARVADSHWDSMIAERMIDMGRIDEGMALIAAMKEFVIDSDEHSFEPEISRLEGELLLAQPGREAEAEACIERAIDQARKAGSRALLLRAATSLARRYVSAGRTEAAQNVLGPVWASFKEGQQTRDLVRAKAALTGVFL